MIDLNTVNKETLVQFLVAVSVALLVSAGIIVVSNASVIFSLIFLMAFFCLCCFWPFHGLLLFLAIALHTQIFSLRLLGFAISNVLLATLLLAFLAYAGIQGQSLHWDLKRICVMKYVAPFFLSILAVSAFNGTEKYLQAVYLCSSLLIPFIFMTVMPDSYKSIEMIFLSFVLSATGMALFGIFEICCSRTFFYSAWTLTERTRFGIIRMGSTAGDPNYLCFNLVPMMPIALYFLVTAITRGGRILFSLILCVLILTTILTFSRIGYLALLLICVGAVYQKVIRCLKGSAATKFIVGMLMIGTIGLSGMELYRYLTLSFTDAVGSSQTRLKALVVSYENARVHPLIGNGLSRLEYVNSRYARSAISRSGGLSSMNTYVQILAENGILSLLSFLLLALTSLRNLFVLQNEIEIFRYLKWSLLLWLFIATTLDSYGSIPFWAIIASSFVGKSFVRGESRSAAPTQSGVLAHG